MTTKTTTGTTTGKAGASKTTPGKSSGSGTGRARGSGAARAGARLSVVTDTTTTDPAATATTQPPDAAAGPAADDLTPARLPVEALHPSAHNVRRELGDIDELTDSVRMLGVLQPLIVAPDPDAPGEWVIIAGHRRYAAACVAGQAEVPVNVRADLTTSVDVVAAMLTENLHRADLTPIEEAAGYQQLIDLGLSAAQVAKRTGRARATVTRRLALLTLPDGVQGRVHAHQVTLEEALALAEFADDPDAVGRLEQALTHQGDLRHTLERERIARDRRARLTGLREQLTADGWTLAVHRQEPAPDGAVALTRPLALHELVNLNGYRDLPDQDARRAAHTDCPHRAAYLWPNGDGWTHVCLNPTSHQPTNQPSHQGLDPSPAPDDDGSDGHDQGDGQVDEDTRAEAARIAAEQDSAERSRLRDQTDCQAAANVRGGYVKDLTTGRIKMTEAMRAGIALHLARAAVVTDDPFGYPAPLDYAAWLGINLPDDADPDEALLAAVTALGDPHRGLLAALAAGTEPALLAAAAWEPRRLRRDPGDVGRRAWLDLLAGPLGYELTDWEAGRLDAADQPPDPTARPA